MQVKITGFDKVQKKLTDLAEAAQNLSGKVSLIAIFDNDFMKTNTNFDSVQTMFDASGIDRLP